MKNWLILGKVFDSWQVLDLMGTLEAARNIEKLVQQYHPGMETIVLNIESAA